METKMKLTEMFQSDFGENPQETEKDKIATKFLSDTRKPKITLAKLNQLRKLREFKKFQKMKRTSLINIMYGKPSAAPSF
jgi:hypothetical protein